MDSHVKIMLGSSFQTMSHLFTHKEDFKGLANTGMFLLNINVAA